MTQATDPTDDESANLAQLNALSSRFGGDDDGVVAVEERELPGWAQWMPPLVQELWAKKAYFNLDASGELTMDGFYKNGSMRLKVQKDGSIIAIDKRNREEVIKSFDDLGMLNYRWWVQSNSKSAYIMPPQPWLDFFRDKKLVKRQVIFLPIDQESEDIS